MAQIEFVKKRDRPKLPCPFRTLGKPGARCTKEGGVCSIRAYREVIKSGRVSVAPGAEGTLVTTCPYRFEQDRTVIRWIGRTLLGDPNPIVVGQLGFLEEETVGAVGHDFEEVGRIDYVLIHPN
jgi:hypothetical protein